MQVFIKGTGTNINLTQREYVGAGGEGTVYTKGGVAYKIYHDPARMLPMGKFQELSAIQDPRVIRPQQILVNDKGKAIGYTSKFVDHVYALCQTFPRDFRNRTGLTQGMVENLIRKFREGVENVHKAGILIVDLNEMNFLVDQNFQDIHFIDVDSYQTPHYDAPAIMESIRDWSVQSHQWSELSDWYSFGIVTFQMFTGIHPFKGKYHGSHQGYATKLPTDADDDSFAVTRRRMQANISVFNPDVHIPGAALPVSIIPASYQAWYRAMFQDGLRCPPPIDFTAAIVIVPVIKKVSGTDQLEIMEYAEYDGNIRGFWSDGTHLTVVTDKTVFLDKTPVCPTPAGGVVGVVYTPKASRAILVEGWRPPKLYNLTDRKDIQLGATCSGMVVHDDRIYIHSRDRVQEVILTDAGTQVIASTKETAQTLEHATQMFPGVIIQNLLGSFYVSLLIASGSAQQVKMPELDGYRVMDAKYQKGVLMVLGEKKGKYNRLVIRFGGLNGYDTREVKDVQPAPLNFTTLDSGVCICMNEEEKLELFASRPGSTSIKIIDDPVFTNDLTILGNIGGQVVFSQGNKIYRMKMR